jgi:hypothetical protein
MQRSVVGRCWPGLLRALITACDADATKPTEPPKPTKTTLKAPVAAKPPDATLPKLFRIVTSTATRPQRPQAHVMRVAGRMFHHVAARLSTLSLSSEAGTTSFRLSLTRLVLRPPSYPLIYPRMHAVSRVLI